ncbi:hypothetical protein MHH52_28155 [Paenibacillus sp. FSL K6-0276]|uniref:hypothetical protein n=1 Tax=Paenibacillus sp. FSL K6-0276 TaxID=2921450 RepID=UPI0030ED4784
MNLKTLEGRSEGEIWNWRSDSDRISLRILTANSGTIQEIWRQQRPEVQIFSVVTTDSLNV